MQLTLRKLQQYCEPCFRTEWGPVVYSRTSFRFPFIQNALILRKTFQDTVEQIHVKWPELVPSLKLKSGRDDSNHVTELYNAVTEHIVSNAIEKQLIFYYLLSGQSWSSDMDEL